VWRWVSVSRRRPWPDASRRSSACGATYCTANHPAAPALAMHEAKRAFRRFLRAVPSACRRFPLRAKYFPQSAPTIWHDFHAMERVAQCSRAEICCEPSMAGLSRESAEAARRIVSIGKKRVSRAPYAPV
jgi:hypothetical protein